MKIQWKKLILCLALPLAVGGIAALITADGMKVFADLEKPPLSPPAWLFPVAWTALYILMGAASYLAAVSKPCPRGGLVVYGIQLFFNFFWPILFFNLSAYLGAFVWLVLLWLLIALCAKLFYDADKRAGLLMLPYLLWVTFAGYLNFGIYLLN